MTKFFCFNKKLSNVWQSQGVLLRRCSGSSCCWSLLSLLLSSRLAESSCSPCGRLRRTTLRWRFGFCSPLPSTVFSSPASPSGDSCPEFSPCEVFPLLRRLLRENRCFRCFFSAAYLLPKTGSPPGPVTFDASLPFSPSTISNSTFSVSPTDFLYLLGLFLMMADWWTKMSSLESSRVMKP